MTHFPMTDIPPRMGRPPLDKNSDTKTTAVRMSISTFERIAAVAGPNRMAAFIREAVEAELQRREKDRAE